MLNAPPVNQLAGIVNRRITTFADQTFWVDALLGNDGNAGTQAAPFKTISAAIALLPLTIRHNFTIKIKAGTYTENLRIAFMNLGDVRLLIDGQDWALSPPATGVAAGTFEGGAAGTKTISCPGAGWTPGNLVGKWVALKSGPKSGTYYPIAGNTDNALELPYHGTTDLNGVSFEIVDHAVRIVNPPGTGDVLQLNLDCGTPTNQRFTIQNVALISSGTYCSMTHGTGAAAITQCRFENTAPNSWVSAAYMTGGHYLTRTIIQCPSGTTGVTGVAGFCSYTNSLINGAAGASFGVAINRGGYMSCAGSIIQGFSSNAVGAGVGILLSKGSGGQCDIATTTIRNCRYGVMAMSTTAARFADSHIQACTVAGVAQSASGGSRSNLRFEGACRLTGNAHGITLDTSHNAAIVTGTTDISGNTGWGINAHANADSGFNNVRIGPGVTMGTNGSGDLTLDGSTATTLAGLRAAAGGVLTDANRFNRAVASAD